MESTRPLHSWPWTIEPTSDENQHGPATCPLHVHGAKYIDCLRYYIHVVLFVAITVATGRCWAHASTLHFLSSLSDSTNALPKLVKYCSPVLVLAKQTHFVIFRRRSGSLIDDDWTWGMRLFGWFVEPVRTLTFVTTIKDSSRPQRREPAHRAIVVQQIAAHVIFRQLR